MSEYTKENLRLSNLATPLLFDRDCTANRKDEDICGVDIPESEEILPLQLNGLTPRKTIGLPAYAEPEIIRHYTRLSQKNLGIDTSFYPLGSCTMKYNPRVNEAVARLPGLADLHPLQPQSTVQGALELMAELADWLKNLTNMPAITLVPAAGAHGELCGMMAIRRALEHKNDARRKVLVPDSAHGTNPATAAALGFEVVSLPIGKNGKVDMAAFDAALSDEIAAMMLTNPNTCGLFESDVITMAEKLHQSGGYFYCDGANFNALVGTVRPGDFGIDAMHINLHKTFSTPHGGGGPGSGPVVFSERLRDFIPRPCLVYRGGQWVLDEGETAQNSLSIGRIKGFHGQFATFVRALAYILSLGHNGLKQVSHDAVLNTRYLKAKLENILSPAYESPAMHEALFDDRFLKNTGITTFDFAKALIDRGFHPMTMYFPTIVNGALLMEPTETESRSTLDRFIAAVTELAHIARHGSEADKARVFHQAPTETPRRRLDETAAARKPVLRA